MNFTFFKLETQIKMSSITKTVLRICIKKYNKTLTLEQLSDKQLCKKKSSLYLFCFMLRMLIPFLNNVD